MDELAIEPAHVHRPGAEEPHGAVHDRVEHRLEVGGGPGDDAQDLGRRRLLFKRLHLALERFCLDRQRLCQALLEVADLWVFALRRPAGERSLGFRLLLRGLCRATHQSLLASHAAIDDSLGDGRRVGNREGEIAGNVCKGARIMGGLIQTSMGHAGGDSQHERHLEAVTRSLGPGILT